MKLWGWTLTQFHWWLGRKETCTHRHQGSTHPEGCPSEEAAEDSHLQARVWGLSLGVAQRQQACRGAGCSAPQAGTRQQTHGKKGLCEKEACDFWSLAMKDTNLHWVSCPVFITTALAKQCGRMPLGRRKRCPEHLWQGGWSRNPWM